MFKCSKCGEVKLSSEMTLNYKTNLPSKLCKVCKSNQKRNRNHLKRIGEYINPNSLEERRKKFLTDSAEFHKGLYTYERVDYLDSHTDVEIFCTRHGGYFFQTPTSHTQGHGCFDCGILDTAKSSTYTTEEFCIAAGLLHNYKYDYSKVVYVHGTLSVIIICPFHGDKEVIPYHHLMGRGCPECAKNGYNTSLPGKLYLMQSENMVKVGITNFCPQERAKHISRKCTETFSVVKYWEWEDGLIANTVETSILQLLRKDYQNPATRFNGWTESFLDVNVHQVLDAIEEKILSIA